MKKIVGKLLIIIAVAGLLFSFIVKIPYEPCCSCPASYRWPGFGIRTLIYQQAMKTTECGECVDTIQGNYSNQGNYSKGCVNSYFVVPVDFIILSILVGVGGIILLRRSNHSVKMEQPKEE
jgi:hypothetical protein